MVFIEHWKPDRLPQIYKLACGRSVTHTVNSAVYNGCANFQSCSIHKGIVYTKKHNC